MQLPADVKHVKSTFPHISLCHTSDKPDSEIYQEQTSTEHWPPSIDLNKQGDQIQHLTHKYSSPFLSPSPSKKNTEWKMNPGPYQFKYCLFSL